MKIVTDCFSDVIEIKEGVPFSLTIENPSAYYDFVSDIYWAINGGDSSFVFSENEKVLNPAKKIELITSFFPVDINEKRIISKITDILEKNAVNEENYNATMTLLADIEKYSYNLSDSFPYKLEFNGININSLIKMIGVKIFDDSDIPIQRIIHYMEIVRDLLGEKLFIFVNMGSFFETKDIESFIENSAYHKFYVLLLDNMDYHYNRNIIDKQIIDKDLCII